MERVVIIGCAGAGKSTLARKIGEQTGLPVVHLDALYWEPNWVEAEPTVFRQRVAEALAGGRWITDGIYNSKSCDLRLPHADLIIWLDQPLLLRLWRVIWRAMRYSGRSRPDMAPGCAEQITLEFLKYIWNFDRVNRPRLEAAITRWAPQTQVLRLRGDRQIANFLEELRLGLGRAHPG